MMSIFDPLAQRICDRIGRSRYPQLAYLIFIVMAIAMTIATLLGTAALILPH